jgi:hypothetical protein
MIVESNCSMKSAVATTHGRYRLTFESEGAGMLVFISQNDSTTAAQLKAPEISGFPGWSR